jgi:hypothetical protein
VRFRSYFHTSIMLIALDYTSWYSELGLVCAYRGWMSQGSVYGATSIDEGVLKDVIRERGSLSGPMQ